MEESICVRFLVLSEQITPNLVPLNNEYLFSQSLVARSLKPRCQRGLSFSDSLGRFLPCLFQLRQFPGLWLQNSNLYLHLYVTFSSFSLCASYKDINQI